MDHEHSLVELPMTIVVRGGLLLPRIALHCETPSSGRVPLVEYPVGRVFKTKVMQVSTPGCDGPEQDRAFCVCGVAKKNHQTLLFV